MIELTDLPSEAAQSYNGSASEVYIIQNSGNFNTLGFISDMGNVRKLVMNGNFIDTAISPISILWPRYRD